MSCEKLKLNPDIDCISFIGKLKVKGNETIKTEIF